MKLVLVAAFLVFSPLQSQAQQRNDIRLIVRDDDMASFHDANVACIKTCKEGIARSIEIMVPCAWFPEAVRLLHENPSIDVGIHLVLTSEWEGIKWRPLADVPSIVDKDGYSMHRFGVGIILPARTTCSRPIGQLTTLKRNCAHK